MIALIVRAALARAYSAATVAAIRVALRLPLTPKERLQLWMRLRVELARRWK